MKKDIDNLMAQNDLDAILILGPAQHNPPMFYMTGGGHLTSAVLIKKAGAQPLLFHQAMERDEAANTGLQTKNLNDYRFNELLKQSNGDVLKATGALYQNILIDAGTTSGRMAVYGQKDAGETYAILSALDSTMPDLNIVGELQDSMLLTAMATKDEDEIERIRRMGIITTGVVGQVADFLTSQRVHKEVLVNSDGDPIKIADVKRLINLWLIERGAENPEPWIFAALA